MLLADIRTSLTQYEGEHGRAISHLELLVKDMVATAHDRQPTGDLIESIRQAHDEVKRFLTEAREQLHAAETTLDILRNQVISLERTWY